MGGCHEKDAFFRREPPAILSHGNRRLRCRWIGTIVTLTFCASAAAASPLPERAGRAWPDTFVARLEALALIETLNARLLAAHTATEVLDHWCASHKLAGEPLIRARRVSGADKPVTPEQRVRLRIGPEEEVAYRRVELACGGHVLAEAENWYVPSRLGPKINRILATTDTPFGRAVHDLKPVRENISVEFLWKPLPDGWELGPLPAGQAGEALAMPWVLFQHRAIVYNSAHEPFSEVSESYTREILNFGPP